MKTIEERVYDIEKWIDAKKASEKFKDGDFVARNIGRVRGYYMVCIYKDTRKTGEMIAYAGCTKLATTTTIGPGWGAY